METINAEPIDLTPEKSGLFTYNSAKDYGLETNLSSETAAGSIQYNRVVFIDSAVQNYPLKIDNLIEPAEVVVLDSQQDGIVQITNHLDRHEDLSAIHIVSHGDSGKLFLGNAELDRATLSQYKDLLTEWDNSLMEDGDIILYGCDVAADLAGASFVKDLSQYTQADILASIDRTGSNNLGGDWDLEYVVGDIESEIIFDIETTANYQNVLTGNIPYTVESAIEYIALDGFNIPGYNPGEAINYNVTTGLPLNGINTTSFSLGASDPFTTMRKILMW